ncbi:MAG: hypothetical protein U5R46_19540 [Gammaproteobacteria bacterium]|nr:hypothetical protein [Gammaproteobacteria bacterium]
MKRDKTAAAIYLTLLLAAALATSAAPAQDEAPEPATGDGATAPEPSTTAPDQQPRSAAEMVTEYLEQDIFLRPGVGLNKVSVGTSFEQVLAAWGEPTSRGTHNLVDNKWTYRIGESSRIILTGGDSVKTMRIQGGISSPYSTTEGASFGMAQHQLATIYGPREAESGTVSYDERGVGFVLNQGQVTEIRIFAPD